MQAYPAYYENGYIIPIGNPVIPEGRRIIITVLDEPSENLIEARLSALKKFRDDIRSSGEVLDEEFDEIVNQRVNISREIDL